MLLLLAVIVLSVMVYWVVDGGWRTWKSLRYLLGSTSRVPEDISGARPSYPDVLKPEVSELKSGGFRRFGEIQVRPPHFGDPVTSWVFIDATRSIAAELSWGRSRWHLNTYFDDGGWLATDYPRGERTLSDGLWADTVGGSVTAAIEHHRVRLQELTELGGIPMTLQRLQDYIERDLAARKEHGLVRVGRLLRLQMARAVAAVFGVGVLLIIGVPHPWLSLNADGAVPILGRTILWLLPAFATMAVTDWLASRPARARPVA